MLPCRDDTRDGRKEIGPGGSERSVASRGLMTNEPCRVSMREPRADWWGEYSEWPLHPEPWLLNESRRPTPPRPRLLERLKRMPLRLFEFARLSLTERRRSRVCSSASHQLSSSSPSLVKPSTSPERIVDPREGGPSSCSLNWYGALMARLREHCLEMGRSREPSSPACLTPSAAITEPVVSSPSASSCSSTCSRSSARENRPRPSALDSQGSPEMDRRHARCVVAYRLTRRNGRAFAPSKPGSKASASREAWSMQCHAFEKRLSGGGTAASSFAFMAICARRIVWASSADSCTA